MSSHLSIYVIFKSSNLKEVGVFSTEINLKFSIVKLPRAIMAERRVVVKGELTSDLRSKGDAHKQNPEKNKAYLWPRSKGWMRAVKRTFNL